MKEGLLAGSGGLRKNGFMIRVCHLRSGQEDCILPSLQPSFYKARSLIMN